MKIGTRSLLFGAHCVPIHTLLIAYAWFKLYGIKSPIDPYLNRRISYWEPGLWACFLLHDLGYWGKQDMDGPEGESHVEWASVWIHFLFDYGDDTRWFHFCRYHSRFYAKKEHYEPSLLCYADKAAVFICEIPIFYIFRAWLSGELKEYMEKAKYGKYATMEVYNPNPFHWFTNCRNFMRQWINEHNNMRPVEDRWKTL